VLNFDVYHHGRVIKRIPARSKREAVRHYHKMKVDGNLCFSDDSLGQVGNYEIHYQTRLRKSLGNYSLTVERVDGKTLRDAFEEVLNRHPELEFGSPVEVIDLEGEPPI
jgi:hypothetical protein